MGRSSASPGTYQPAHHPDLFTTRSWGFFIITRDTLAFNTESDIWLDAGEFERQFKDLGLSGRSEIPNDADSAAKLQAALDLYQGDFLDGFHLRDGIGFEEWAILQREHLRQTARDGFRFLTHYYRKKNSHTEGLLSASRWQRFDPYDEEACRTLMGLYMRTGQRAAALQCYQNLKQKLNTDLHISPASASTDLFRKFQQIEFPPMLNLPAAATPFVGRQNEIIELAHRLTSTENRLVTITGPGGMGKMKQRAIWQSAPPVNFYMESVLFRSQLWIRPKPYPPALPKASDLYFTARSLRKRKYLNICVNGKYC
ncbi:bacterial transcriptional activator domain-containing protein [Candidatus Villigracilis proximus]|uniref:bacterial transcriptional activator domain-containing protein n=1 Tax=Candidatus Villigracilis proximus TaxID=3140683 RepID=UPI0031EA94A6